jgi:hypothetical protein
MEWGNFGKSLIIIGLGVVALGLVVVLVGRSQGLTALFGWLGRLPGDIVIKRDNFVFYFPLATSILISVVLTVLITVLSLFLKR